MKTYKITITGLSDLLMHADNIGWAEEMKRWRETPANKAKSVAGDDRSPACTWIGGMYHDEEHVAIPSDNLMRCLMEGGAQVPVPGGKNGKTFKAQTQSGMLVVEAYWALLVHGKLIPVDEILALRNEEDFQVHVETVKRAGFALLVKRAKIGSSKHVRVRPRFPAWSASGTLQVWDDRGAAEAAAAPQADGSEVGSGPALRGQARQGRARPGRARATKHQRFNGAWRG